MTMDRTQSQADQSKTLTVLSIECLKGSSKAEEWTGDMLQTGDIVEELRIGGSVTVKSPFKNGRSGVQKILHSSFRSKDTSIVVRVRRGPSSSHSAELQACIVPNESFGKKQYMLRSIDDPNYAVGFCDRSESECLQLIGASPFAFSLPLVDDEESLDFFQTLLPPAGSFSCRNMETGPDIIFGSPKA
ncbi:hypothetical protein SAY86_031997 [Trapa natans]|uniref:Uncharacterized protein n=1 Tax=Trapa natans TaxID=22666 RepID=A0AAN7R424_TRANT|nr:hypothetical protein SAY86_031997 [Trapa natans]